MALQPKMKTAVDLRVSEEVQRVVALKVASEVACTSMAQGYTMQNSEVFDFADECLSWLRKDGAAPQDDEQGTG